MNLINRSVQTDAEESESALVGMGLVGKWGRDFQEYRARVAKQPKRHAVAPQFVRPCEQNRVTDALWMCWYNQDGGLVHTQAMQLLDLRGSSVAEHIADNLKNYAPAMPEVDLQSARAIKGPQASKLTGKVVYHGEAWLDSSLRGGKAAVLFQRFGFHRATREWDPDAIFGLMSWALACSGFAARIGYAHLEPLAAMWNRETQKSQHQVWTVYTKRDDFQHLSLLPVVDFSDHIARKFQ